jgi:hypothetical protein
LNKPIALISIIGFVALACFACAPPSPSGPPRSMAQVCNNGVINPVPFLKVPFDPTYPENSNYDKPPEADPAPVNPDVQSDLSAAFQAAPPFFKAQLCSLQGIFINPTGCSGYDPSTCNLADTEIAENSWGFRLRSPSKEGYIAISLGLWKNKTCQNAKTACVAPLQTYETRRLLALLNVTANRDLRPLAAEGRKPRLNLPTYEISSGVPALTVLAALAHEYGHVFWWNAFVEPGAPHVSNTASFCNGSFYPSGSWQGVPVDLPPKRWVHFGEILGQPRDSDVSQLARFLQSGDYSQAFERLHLIYANGRWASALAAFSPDEDFVETFQLFVLMNAGLRQATVTSYGRGRHSDNIISGQTVPLPLQSKLQCFASPAQPR